MIRIQTIALAFACLTLFGCAKTASAETETRVRYANTEDVRTVLLSAAKPTLLNTWALW